MDLVFLRGDLVFVITDLVFGMMYSVVGMLGFWIHGVVGVMASLHYSGSTDGCDYLLCICNKYVWFPRLKEKKIKFIESSMMNV